MRYYVTVGRGGPFFRISMVVTGILGSLVYWRASRRRAAAASETASILIEHIKHGDHPASGVFAPTTDEAKAASSLSAQPTRRLLSR